MDSEEEEEALLRTEQRKQAASRKRKATYQEPRSKTAKRATFVRPGPGANAAPSRQRTARRAAVASRLCPPERARRASTANKTRESETTRLADEKLRSRAKPKPQYTKCQFTQEEMLTESIATEQDNTRWILSMQRLSRQRAQQPRGGQSQSRSAVRFLSRRGSTTTVTFSEVESQPGFFRPGAPSALLPPAPDRHLCAVTRLPAKYRDPLTGQPFANAAAFRIIRAQHHGRGDEATPAAAPPPSL